MFKFEMQAVLDYRKSIEDRMLLDFAGKARHLEVEKERLGGLRRKKSSLVFQFGVMQKKEMNAGDVSSLLSYLDRIKGEESSQESVVQKVRAELEEKRKKLLEAVKRRKVIEVLRDRQLEEHRRNTIRKEMKRLDEFGINRYQREEDKENHRRL